MMRTAEQIYKAYKPFISAVSKDEAIHAIRIIQEEAYNQAISDASEKARTRTNDESTSIIVDKESILMLKKKLLMDNGKAVVKDYLTTEQKDKEILELKGDLAWILRRIRTHVRPENHKFLQLPYFAKKVEGVIEIDLPKSKEKELLEQIIYISKALTDRIDNSPYSLKTEAEYLDFIEVINEAEQIVTDEPVEIK